MTEGQETVTAETFIDLYSNMRSGTDINETDQFLYNLYGNENSIPILFEIIKNSEDSVLTQYALYGIAVCLRKIDKKLSRKQLSLTRKLILEILKSATDSIIINAAISVISELLLHFKEWPELTQLLFDESIGIESLLQLSSRLINYTNAEKMNAERLRFFQELIMNGLQSEDFAVISSSIELLYNLAKPYFSNPNIDNETIESFNAYSEPLLGILSNIGSSGVSDTFTQVTTPILDGIENGFDLLPFSQTVELIVSIIQSGSSDTEYILRLHTFLANIIYQHPEATFTPEEISALFELELTVGLAFFQMEDDDPTMNWLFDFDGLLSDLYNRLPPNDVIQLTDLGLTNLNQMETAEARCCTLLIVENALFYARDELEAKHNDFFQLCIEMLCSENSIEKHMSERFLEIHAKTLSTQINNNIQTVYTAVLDFIRTEDSSVGSNLLFLITLQIENPDPVLEELIQNIYALLGCSDDFVQINAVKTLHLLIKASKMKIDFLYDDVVQHIFECVQTDDPATIDSTSSTVFACVVALAERVPNKMAENFGDFLPIIVGAMASEDKFVQMDAISAYNQLLSVMYPQMEGSISEVIEHLTSLIECPDEKWTNKIITLLKPDYVDRDEIGLAFERAKIALLCFVKIASLTLDPNLLDYSAKNMNSFLGIPNGMGEFTAFEILHVLAETLPKLETIEEPMKDAMWQTVNQCIIFLDQANYDDYDRLSTILDSLCTVFRFCGVSSLENGDEILIGFLQKTIEESKNIHTNMFQLNTIMNSKNYALAIIDVATLRGDTYAFDVMLPIFQELIQGQTVAVTKFAYEAVTNLILSKAELIPDELKGQMLELTHNYLEEGHHDLAVCAADFITNLCDIEPLAQVIAENSGSIMGLLVTRLTNAGDKIDLKEALIGAIESLAETFSLDISPAYEPFFMSLPLERRFDLCDQVYQYIAELVQPGSENIFPFIVRTFVGVVARPWSRIVAMEMSDLTLYQIGQALSSILSQVQNPEATISETLFGNEMMIQCYKESWEVLITIEEPPDE